MTTVKATDYAEPEQLAKIFAEAEYMVLATSSGNQPLATPVFHAFGRSGLFNRYAVFWASSPKSYHSRQIENNPNVSVSIYDQNMPQGTGFGLRLNGRAQILDEISYDFIRGYELLKSKALNMPETKAELLAKDSLRKIYMLEIQDVRANAAIEYEGKSGWQDVSHIAPDILRLAADN